METRENLRRARSKVLLTGDADRGRFFVGDGHSMVAGSGVIDQEGIERRVSFILKRSHNV